MLSIKAKHIAHSGAMEMQGLLLCVQWLLRSVARFSSRAVIGIDAKAVLYAVLKGRSSAPTFSPIVRRVAAHCLAGDLMIYPLYVPSESNAADAPSRGARKRPAVRREMQKPKWSRLKRHCHRLKRSWQHLVDCGMVPPTGNSESYASSI